VTDAVSPRFAGPSGSTREEPTLYTETIQALGDQAAAKLAAQKQSLTGHFIRSMLAGAYVGAAIVLVFTIGGLLAPFLHGGERLLMGVCFGGALTIVLFAGSELFTGSNLVLTLGVLTRKASLRDLGSNWLWTWLGNLAGSVLLAVLVFRSGVLKPVEGFVLKVATTKMELPAEQLFLRAILANWLVCLGVWMAARIKSETGRILMIWWCMFTFITSGYEHSVANMCGLMLGVLLKPEPATWAGYGYNLSLSTLGNVVGGAFFVAGVYWWGSSPAQSPVVPSVNGTLAATTSGDVQALEPAAGRAG
jgi:nitrite transporter NirC